MGRMGQTDVEIFRARYASPLGGMVLEATATQVVGVRFAERAPEGEFCAQTPILKATAAWLDAYFAGRRPSASSVPLAPEGTPFARRVWALVQQIPYGRTMTYGALAAAVARELGRPAMSAQAVGGAVGRNPIVLLVPCHRVVGVGGALVGYADGLERKRWLLGLERGGNAF